MSRFPRALLAALMVLGACSVPTDESAVPLDPETLPEPLQPGFTATTTTTPEEDTTTYEVFLLNRETERTLVQGVPRELTATASLAEVLETLFVGATDVEREELNLISRLADVFRLQRANDADGVAEVDIIVLGAAGEPAEEQSVDAETLRDIAAQLVWTATEYSEEIDRLRLFVDGELASLPTALGDTPDPVGREDYPLYDPDFTPPLTTTTTTTAPATAPTTVPSTAPATAPTTVPSTSVAPPDG